MHVIDGTNDFNLMASQSGSNDRAVIDQVLCLLPCIQFRQIVQYFGSMLRMRSDHFVM